MPDVLIILGQKARNEFCRSWLEPATASHLGEKLKYYREETLCLTVALVADVCLPYPEIMRSFIYFASLVSSRSFSNAVRIFECQ